MMDYSLWRRCRYAGGIMSASYGQAAYIARGSPSIIYYLMSLKNLGTMKDIADLIGRICLFNHFAGSI